LIGRYGLADLVDEKPAVAVDRWEEKNAGREEGERDRETF
jgi:hypothetical protein